MTAQIQKGAVECATDEAPPIRITRGEGGTDKDAGPYRHGYTTSYTPTLIIALRQVLPGRGPGEIVDELLTLAGIIEGGTVEGVGWVGTTRTVVWVTLSSVEAADTLLDLIVNYRDEEYAGLEVFQLKYVYDD